MRCLFDNNKGYVLDYNVSHGEKIKYILTELHQPNKYEGQKPIGDPRFTFEEVANVCNDGQKKR